jgi:cytochrome oxidase Cu insertion factor (SCO1/SenC/PrrC family)
MRPESNPLDDERSARAQSRLARAPFALIAVGAISAFACAWLAARAIEARAAPGRGGSGVVLAQPAESPEVFGEVAPFVLVERSGADVRLDDLLGEPWVASCVFTRCTGPCPAVTSNMKKLQDRLKGSRAKLVTFSVDPDFDTPQVLSAYAAAVNADPKRWLFLTGASDVVDALIRRSFFFPVERNAEAPVGQRVSHRTQLVAVDKRGRVRGFYSGETDHDLDLIAARVRFLEHEEPTPAPAR